MRASGHVLSRQPHPLVALFLSVAKPKDPGANVIFWLGAATGLVSCWTQDARAPGVRRPVRGPGGGGAWERTSECVLFMIARVYMSTDCKVRAVDIKEAETQA